MRRSIIGSTKLARHDQEDLIEFDSPMMLSSTTTTHTTTFDSIFVSSSSVKEQKTGDKDDSNKDDTHVDYGDGEEKTTSSDLRQRTLRTSTI